MKDDIQEAYTALINPCYGDPANRNVNEGSFMSEKAFVTALNSTFSPDNSVTYIKAGPRLHTVLQPTKITMAVSTSGGLCPGLNVVIRELVMSSWYNYGVRKIFGIKWGYEGAQSDEDWIELTPEKVRDIHREGGTILGTSRCEFNAKSIADKLIKNGVNVYYSIGGDGTHRGLQSLADELNSRGIKISLCGIPKTIDNDIPLIDRSFGFETAIEEAVKVIQVGNVECNSTKNGIGLVRVFGRHCGFIALQASKASRDVNICLIPESPFCLYGEKGLLKFIFNRLAIKNHCLIVVAEGSSIAVLDYKISDTGMRDKSGNPILPDIGDVLKNEIKEYVKINNLDATLKYIDPTYIIRGCAPNSFDINYCA